MSRKIFSLHLPRLSCKALHALQPFTAASLHKFGFCCTRNRNELHFGDSEVEALKSFSFPYTIENNHVRNRKCLHG
jgi:hypothetical protein